MSLLMETTRSFQKADPINRPLSNCPLLVDSRYTTDLIRPLLLDSSVAVKKVLQKMF
jgi:hypothetical protein